MSEEHKNDAPNEERPEVKKTTPAPPKRNPVSPFNKNNRFISPKSGNPGSKGGVHKGGGMKKGK
jgi:hypothetical protein